MSKHILEMSDEEVMEMLSPPETGASATSEEKEENSDTPETSENTEVEMEENEEENSSGSEEEDEGNSESEGETPETDPENAGEAPETGEADHVEEQKPEEKTPVKEAKEKPHDKPKTEKPSETVDEPDYKAAYERLMGPIKANGKEIKLESVDEAIKLIQMGANYTKKLQALQPNLKILRMLENNQLLNEDRLNHLIDVAKGNKGAIQKLLKDNNIDPMDIDEESGKTYKAGNHKISDTEIKFNQTLEDVTSTPEGQSVIIDVQKKWDQASREVIFSDPEILSVIVDHKAKGWYDAISTEYEKRRMLGDREITSLPFLNAYKVIGDDLAQKGLLPNSGQQAETGKTQEANVEPKTEKQPEVIARGTAPKKRVDNGEQAKAASPTKNSAKAKAQDFNPLAMSDDEFLKQMANRY